MKHILITIAVVLLLIGCKDAIVVFDNEACTEAIAPTNLPQLQSFYSKDWILYQNGDKTDLQLADEAVIMTIRFTTNGTGVVTIKDTNTVLSDSSLYNFEYRFCKTDCNCNLIRIYGSVVPTDKYHTIVYQLFQMKMYSAVNIPINNGANSINALLLMDEKNYSMTFR
jgi:hypothetical protein